MYVADKDCADAKKKANARSYEKYDFNFCSYLLRLDYFI
jgi:hypothetical protein